MYCIFIIIIIFFAFQAIRLDASALIFKKKPIFQMPIKVQNLGDVYIGNNSKKPIVINSVTFLYKFQNVDEEESTQKTHTITFPQAHMIPPQKAFVFTIMMKNNRALQFVGITRLQTDLQSIVFEPIFTDLSLPIMLNYTKKGNVQCINKRHFINFH